MTLRHLNIFLAVCRTQNITRAAEQLHLTQPTVTRAVQELERYYGVCLFDRLGRGVQLTESGKLLFAHALHIQAAFDELEQGLRSWEQTGLLRIGATPTLASTLLTRALPRFRESRGQLQLRTAVYNGTDLQRRLTAGELDFALIEGSVTQERLHREPLTEDRLILILPPDDPRLHAPELRLEEAAAGPLLLREPGSMGRQHVEQVFARHGLTPEPVMESISTHAIIQSVHMGLGVSFLPENLVRHSVETGFVATREIADEPFTRRNYLAWHEQKYLGPAARELIALLRALAAE